MVFALPRSLIPDIIDSSQRRAVEENAVASLDATEAGGTATTDVVKGVVSAQAPVADESDDVLVVKTQDDLESRYTIKQLKDMCAERGLPIVGKKRELTERILEHDRSDAS